MSDTVRRYQASLRRTRGQHPPLKPSEPPCTSHELAWGSQRRVTVRWLHKAVRAVEETLPLDALCCAQALTLSERNQLSRAESLKLSRKQPDF